MTLRLSQHIQLTHRSDVALEVNRIDHKLWEELSSWWILRETLSPSIQLSAALRFRLSAELKAAARWNHVPTSHNISHFYYDRLHFLINKLLRVQSDNQRMDRACLWSKYRVIEHKLNLSKHRSECWIVYCNDMFVIFSFHQSLTAIHWYFFLFSH